MTKTALITGITGQDGAYLAELLLHKGYNVHGIRRHVSIPNTQRIDHLSADHQNLHLHYGDMTDSSNLIRIVQETQPDEIYNLAAMSHVHVSFDQPEYVADADGVGTLRLLEAVRLLGLKTKTRLYQASTSELYGQTRETPQSEDTPFHPRSPYAVAKMYAYWITVNYREAYGMFASNGILFNHESPLRGETFVTRKITRTAAQIALGLTDTLLLGNLDASRDWGHAKDYVEAMYRILQHDVPDDFVVATGVSHTVRDFAERSFAEIGISLTFNGKGLDEKGRIAKIDADHFLAKTGIKPAHLHAGQVVVAVSSEFFRPADVHALQGNPAKAMQKLGWKARHSLTDIISDMMTSDIALSKQERLLQIPDHTGTALRDVA